MVRPRSSHDLVSAPDRRRSVILHVNHVSQVSGAEVSLLTLLSHLSRPRFTSILACPGGGGLAARAHDLGIQVEAVSLVRLYRRSSFAQATRAIRSLARSTVQLVRIIRRNAVEVVHANSTTAALVAVLAARRCRVPAIWHSRDLMPPQPIASYLGRLADAVVVPARHLAQAAVARGLPAGKIWLIPNGVDSAPFQQAARPARSRPRVGMIAQLVPWKRHADFLRAAALIHQSIPAARFLIVGADLFGDHPAYRQELVALGSRLGLDDHLTWLPYQENIAPVMAGLDVLILPACEEPFGRVIVEALAAGVVPVAVAAAGPAELITSESIGLLVSCGDVQAFADAACRLLEDRSLRERMAQAGQAFVRQRFTASVTAQQFEQCLEYLLR